MNDNNMNVFGEKLAVCSLQPLTGFLRDGDCRLPATDAGQHGVCAQVTHEFLDYTKKRGNDLTVHGHVFTEFRIFRFNSRW